MSTKRAEMAQEPPGGPTRIAIQRPDPYRHLSDELGGHSGDVAADLRAPFPYFGGKRAVARLVWERLGTDVAGYVEPFFGSGAVLLGRPGGTPARGHETVNDNDGLVSNFWRAVVTAPDAVAQHADWPCNENDLHARHAWLTGQKESLQARLEGSPDWHDAKVAGWWAWGLSLWIGSGFCSGRGPWQVQDGTLQQVGRCGGGVARQLPHLSDAGQGVARNMPHLGDNGRGGHRAHLEGQGVRRQSPRLSRNGQGVTRQGIWRVRPHLGTEGQGINRQLPHLGNAGRGVHRAPDDESGTCAERRAALVAYMRALSDRLRGVRVCCGDWARITTPAVLFATGSPVAVFLDPPYADTAGRQSDLYRLDDLQVAHAVREWALAWGDDPRLRIALAGYAEEHDMPATWTCVQGQASGGHGYGGQRRAAGVTPNENSKRERLWFSPHCLRPEEGRVRQPSLFGEEVQA